MYHIGYTCTLFYAWACMSESLSHVFLFLSYSMIHVRLDTASYPSTIAGTSP